MTAPDQLDQHLSTALEELAGPGYPDYFDEALQRAVQRAQRPAWTFPGRWIPVSTGLGRAASVPALPWRPLVLLLVLLALLATALIVSVASRPDPKPAPFGPAANGIVAYEVRSDDLAESDIHVWDPQTGADRVLIGGPDYDYDPRFSLDGTMLSFIRDSRDGVSVMVADADGTNARSVFTAPADLTTRAWSPDGRQLAIIAKPQSSLWLVSVMHPEPREIPLPVDPWSCLGWRPADGDELIFMDRGGEIYSVRADGSGFRQISTFSPTYGQELPDYAFSPDGTTLAYVVNFQLHLFDLDTGADRVWGTALPKAQKTEYSEVLSSPRFSPDGTTLAFTRHWGKYGSERQVTMYRAANHQVWVAPVAGDGAGAVAVGPLVQLGEGHHGVLLFALSPDGRKVLVYAGFENLIDPSASYLDVWLASLNGGDPIHVDVPVFGDWQRLPP